jgi:hypothetical protein
MKKNIVDCLPTDTYIWGSFYSRLNEGAISKDKNHTSERLFRCPCPRYFPLLKKSRGGTKGMYRS